MNLSGAEELTRRNLTGRYCVLSERKEEMG